MLSALVSAFSFSEWASEVWVELVRFYWSMNVTQYSILAACAVTFGFLCLKGTGINRP